MILTAPAGQDWIYASEIQAAIDSLQPRGGEVMVDAAQVYADSELEIGDVDGDGIGTQSSVTLRGRGSSVFAGAAGTVWVCTQPMLAAIAVNGPQHHIKDMTINCGGFAQDGILFTSNTSANVNKPASDPWRNPTSGCGVERVVIMGAARASIALRASSPDTAADQIDTISVRDCTIVCDTAAVPGLYGIEVDVPNSGDGLALSQVSFGGYGVAGLHLKQGGSVQGSDEIAFSSHEQTARAAILLGRWNVRGLTLRGFHMEQHTGDGIATDGVLGGTVPLVLDGGSILVHAPGSRAIRWQGPGLVCVRGTTFGVLDGAAPDAGGMDFSNPEPESTQPQILQLDLRTNYYGGTGHIKVPEAQIRSRRIVGEFPAVWGVDPRLRRVGLST